MTRAHVRKAAVLLSSLPREQADELIARLDHCQARAVLAEITKGERVSADEQELVILEFATLGRNVEIGTNGEKLRASDPMQAARLAIANGPMPFLRDVPPQALAHLLSVERPQTIALIASRLPSAYGAELLAAMPQQQQLDVIRAVAALAPTDADVVADVARVVEARISRLVA